MMKLHWQYGQKLRSRTMQINWLNAKRAVGRVQNTQCMEIEDNQMTAEDWKRQFSELASTKREMKANTDQLQQAFAEFG
jgi:cell division septum initiation protein DivIVA